MILEKNVSPKMLGQAIKIAKQNKLPISVWRRTDAALLTIQQPLGSGYGKMTISITKSHRTAKRVRAIFGEWSHASANYQTWYYTLPNTSESIAKAKAIGARFPKKYPPRMAVEIKRKPTQQRMFNFLNELRDSGVINMLGATPYLMQAYNLDTQTAVKTLADWMKSHEPH